ncbi:hypothetical protein EDD86DRAFT_966 [Gorgonomyces haynaldii]|nr:hypothetical protein EDD86DRAFT_966 [Gorgonomyces haynaldii]
MSYFLDHGLQEQKQSKPALNPVISDFMSLNQTTHHAALELFQSLRHTDDQAVLDNLITQLMNEDSGKKGPPPASKHFRMNLEKKRPSQDATCAICQDDFEHLATHLPCSHVFHSSCILPWLQLHNTCPVCRVEFPTEEPEDDEGEWDPFYS